MGWGCMTLGPRWRFLIALVAGIASSGCAPLNPPTVRPGEQPLDEIHIMSYTSSDPASHVIRSLPRSAYRRKWFFLARPAPRRPRPPYDKIHPEVRRWMATRPPTDLVLLMVSYRDTVPIPRFPFAHDTLDRDLSLLDVSTKTDSAKTVIGQLKDARKQIYESDTLNFALRYGARVLQAYWLTQATLVEMPLGRVDSLSRHPRVVYIRSNRGNTAPNGHGDSNPNNNPEHARDQIGTEHYYDPPLDLGYGWMALLDTGVRTTHWLMSGLAARLCVADCLPSGSCVGVDDPKCVPPDEAYSGGLPGDQDEYGHGTSSAAILTANTRFGEEFRGVTRIWLDSYQVYKADGHVDVDAAIRAFELAAARLNPVIVAEMQEHTPEYADVGAAAERAYQAGAVIIAANGNYDTFVAGQPAQGSHVIGVGAYDLENQTPSEWMAWGLMPDLIPKPDILGPTSSETAGNLRNDLNAPPALDDESLRYHGTTSGATPYVAGAASLVRNWMNVGLSSSVDAGQVYSHLILSGDRVGPFVTGTGTDTDPYVAASPYGAGRIRLPTTGGSRWGKAWSSANIEPTEIPIEITENGIVRVDAAIWWPQPLDDGPNNLDLELVGPGGVSIKSFSIGGVFERVALDQPSGLSGNWRLRIHPTSVGDAAQVFYWGVALQTSPPP